MSLKRNVRKSIEGGSTSYATVEANNNGFITVKLLGSNSRITNLEYVGSIVPQVGDQVVLDYSAGDKPIVRVDENQVYAGERYMLETTEPIEMQPAYEEPKDDGGDVPGGEDLGLAVTTKPSNIEYPNEPHAKDTPWIQHWGINTGIWQCSIYDSGGFDDNPTMGTQYFIVPVSGVYLITLELSADIATQGILRARVMRTFGTDPDVPFLKGIASPSGYGDYFNLNTSKIVYLPQGEVISVELMYTGSGSAYSLKDTANPLKWVTTQNEFIFKIQLLTISTGAIVEPEVPDFEPGYYYWWGATKTFNIAAVGSGGSVELPTAGNPSPWYIDDVDENGSNDFRFPAGHEVKGMKVTLNAVTYSGDCVLVYGTNTNWCKKFNDYWTSGENEMYQGETLFMGTAAAAAWAEMTNDPGCDWEGGYWEYGGVKYYPQIRVFFQLGYLPAHVNFTLTPVWYGWLDEEP